MIAAVTMVRDEDDIIAPILTQLFAQGVDRIWIADNMSSDKTRPILDDLAVRLPLTIIDDDEPGFYQSLKMTALAKIAADAGATWILPFDADEYWYALDGTIASTLAGLEFDVLLANGYDHLPQRTDPDDDNPIRRLGWRRNHHLTFPNVVFRPIDGAYIHQGNHNVEHPGSRTAGHLEFRHYQWRTLPQMIRKVRQGKAAYEASTVNPTHGSHWRKLGGLSDDDLADEWEWLLDQEGLVYDPAPMP